MTFKEFCVAAGIRALKTFAQALIAIIGTDAIGVTDVDWMQAAEVAALAAILSLLMSAASMPFGEKGTPGLPGEDIGAKRARRKAALEADDEFTDGP